MYYKMGLASANRSFIILPTFPFVNRFGEILQKSPGFHNRKAGNQHEIGFLPSDDLNLFVERNIVAGYKAEPDTVQPADAGTLEPMRHNPKGSHPNGWLPFLAQVAVTKLPTAKYSVTGYSIYQTPQDGEWLKAVCSRPVWS